ncbi:methylated-DNA--[protein]-cysteine S-methyltransferase [Fibrella forsythiae]|uniref:Methylated-DNA--[protein]-cysteine S-methyltransferase n=1 Tax=Fibrella forsythiae TaxID=2817061 RepID=A0ABS3JHI2_9BACT|nr:methylated-DNA--[protein]-cysteine S-methyltransferase [Fibrella forsythiae]MBO0949470.1 methylated-DNA--[protein]-cysteine S-methyltransferase [Fibrella forsythiae]
MNADNAHTYEQIARAIDYLMANFREQPSLSKLAETANLSEFHFQRLFTEWAGVSPKKFGQYLTLDYAKAQLQNGAPLSAAAEAAGLSGTGRLHDLFVTIEGVTPGQFKQAGSGLVLTYGVFDSPFGAYVVGVINGKIAVLHFMTSDDAASNVPEQLVATIWPDATLQHNPSAIQAITGQLFPTAGDSSTERPGEPVRVLMRGSAFQLKVWEALLRIPEGRLVSYDQIAEAIGQPAASRAVGTAIGSNPVGYLIPCHRVIKKTGLFGGYRWGTSRKQAMLGWEAARVLG